MTKKAGVINMKESLKHLINILIEKDDYFLTKDLAKRMNCSPRYINKIIEDIDYELYNHCFFIQYKSHKGYKLEIRDQKKYYEMMSLKSDNEHIDKSVLKLLVDYDDYIRIDDIADYFFISRSHMDRMIKSVKKLAGLYDLKIISKPKYGIRIEGTEMNKRLCSAHLRNIKDIQSEDLHIIQDILYSILKEFEYSITDMNFNNLVYHLFILLRRIQKGHELLEEIQLHQVYELQNQIADKILEKLNEQFHIIIPIVERNYIVLHLLGKQTITKNQEIPEKIFELTNQILERIYDEQSIDLRNDVDLRISLCLHLQPLLFRLKYNFNQKNPMLSRVKREIPQGYEMAIIAKKVIKELYHVNMNEDEAAFLAMHFYLALMKQEERSHQMKFLVICSTGRGTAQLLVFKLMEKYSIDENDIIISSLMQMKDIDLSSFSCVMTTVPISYEIPIPIIQINPMLDERSMKKIDGFIKSKNRNDLQNDCIYKKELFFTCHHLKTKEDVFHFIIEQIQVHFPYETITIEDLIKREELSSTEIGNQCCMPHPLNYYPQQPIVLIIVLKKQIKWFDKKVRYIFFIALPKQFSTRTNVLDEITSLVCDSEKLTQLSLDNSFDHFMSLLRE